MKGDDAVHGFDCCDPSCVHPDHLFRCARLSCTLTRRACVTRQMVSDYQRTNDVANETLRGQSSDFPLCVTAACPVGLLNRDLHDPDRAEVLKVYGPPGSKWTPSKRGHAKSVEMASRARLLAVGMLDEVPTLDTPPLPVPPEDDGAPDETGPEAHGEDSARRTGGELPRDGGARGRGGTLDRVRMEADQSGVLGGPRKSARGSGVEGPSDPAHHRRAGGLVAGAGVAPRAKESGTLGREAADRAELGTRGDARQAPRGPAGGVV